MNQSNFNLEQIFSPSRCISADLLLKYANNELSDQEEHSVERHLTDCPFCEDALEGISLTGSKDFSGLLQQANTAIESRTAAGREENDGKVIEFRPETQPAAPAAASPRNTPNLFRTLSIAASVLLLAVAGFFFFRAPITPEHVAAEYFQVFELGHTRSIENISANVYDQAKLLYQDKKYTEAAPLFDQVDSIQALYSAANCYYMVGKYDLAADRFQAVIDKGDGYSEDAEFGLAMTYLMQHEVAQARGLLEDMAADSRHNYKLIAKEALAKVESL